MAMDPIPQTAEVTGTGIQYRLLDGTVIALASMTPEIMANEMGAMDRVSLDRSRDPVS
jgi:hypothetical protein